MITVLPDNSFQLPRLTDEVQYVQPSMVPSSTPEKVIQSRGKKIFSASNIIIGLIALSLVVGILYFYLPDSAVEKNNITEVQKSLFRIQQSKGQLQNPGLGSPKVITRPNDGTSSKSSSNSGSSTSSSSSNDQSSKHTKPIRKSQKMVIGGGSGAPGKGDDEDEQDKEKDRKKDIALPSQDQQQQQGQQQQEQQQQDDQDQLNDIVNDLQQMWLDKEGNEEIPLLGKIRN